MFTVLAAAAVALGFYAVHLRHKVAGDEETTTVQQTSVAPVGNGPPQPVTLYIANDSDGTLRKAQLSFPLPSERSERARAVLQALLQQYMKAPSPHPIGAGSDIRQVYLMDDGIAIVDTNAAFANAHPSGVLTEELTVASLVMTLNANDNQISRVKILVSGQQRETLAGHADLKRFYEASNIGAIVRDMQ
jgi:hypothetical protein